MAKRISRERERYLAARRELNPRTTQAGSSHEPLSRDSLGGFLRICEDRSTNIAGICFPHPDKPLLVNSMTPTKKTSRHRHLLPPILVPQFRQKHSEELKHTSHFPTTSPSTEPFSLPSQEYETTSTMAIRTSSRLKRSSESAGLSSTVEPPTTTKKPCSSWRSWTTSEGLNLERSQIPLHHHHPLTSPF